MIENNRSVIPFEFEGKGVRVLDQSGEPWFVLADVCRVLEHTNPSKAAERLDDDEKNTLTISEGIRQGAGNPNVSVVNESGLYSLILTSRKPAAKRFKKWVTSEVLPSIRKTGGYGRSAPGISPEILAELVGAVMAQCEARFDAKFKRRLDAELIQGQFGVIRDHKTAGEVANLAGIPSKGRRGLIRVISNGMVRHCAQTGVIPRPGVLGSNRAWLFPVASCHDWLDHAGGREKIREALDRKAGQGVLKLVQPAPKKGDGPAKGA